MYKENLSYSAFIQSIIALVILISLGSCENNSLPKKDFTNLEIDIPLEYAKGLKISESNNYIKIDIIQNQQITSTYYLDSIIPCPVKSFSCVSSTHIAFLDLLNEMRSLKGFSYPDFVQNETFKNMYQNGDIKNIGNEFHVNQEVLLSIKPDVLMIYPFESNEILKMEKYGVNIVQNIEYLENHPLGQLEWIKLFGELFHKRDLANHIFDSIKNNYLSHIQDANNESKPVVLVGEIYNDSWVTPSKNSLFAQYLKDAKVEMVDIGSMNFGSEKIDIEVVLSKLNDIDYWIYTTHSDDVISTKLLKSKHKLYDQIMKHTKGVLVCNTFSSNYFEKGIIMPDLILSDFVNYFHHLDSNSTYHFFHPLTNDHE